jgi:LPXTG-motif cell wall-anchored protein
LPFSTARDTVTLIIAGALVLAALLSLLGQKRK